MDSNCGCVCLFFFFFLLPGLYPVAFAIVDAESERNWRWFLEILAQELGRQNRRITFISDRNAGLLSALPKVFPDSAHGFCFRHLQANLLDRFPGCGSYLRGRLAYLFMCCAYSRTPAAFEYNLEIFKNEGGQLVEDFLTELPKENWCSAYFNGERFGEMTNNLAESFNSWILDLRSLPILEIVDGIRVKLMGMMANRREAAKSWFTELCPVMEDRLKENLNVGRHWRVSRSDTDVYEVHCQKYSVMVNLETRFCSCGEWQVHGFPCSHALVVIQQHGASPYDYVNELYKVVKFRETYSFSINPVPTIEKPMHNFAKDVVIVKPPLTRKPPGRPRTKRFKKKSETTKSIKCSRCGKAAGHNKKTCNVPI